MKLLRSYILLVVLGTACGPPRYYYSAPTKGGAHRFPRAMKTAPTPEADAGASDGMTAGLPH
jgi:hypothetical protein